MGIAAPVRKSLSAVGAVMESTRDLWWIIASAAAALHGAAPITVADVDVLLSVRDAHRVLPALGVQPLPGSDHPDFRSEVFGTWRKPPIPVEFMAGFRRREGAAWFLVEPATRQAVDVGNAVVYIPERDELRSMIESFGRPKDLERAHLLATLG